MTRRNKTKAIYTTFIILISITFLSLLVPFTFALFEKEGRSEGLYGGVSLRSYFERGDGSEDDPYVITRPRHMYNLSRLQGLGVFGEKKYFELGLVGLGGDESGKPLCYLDDSSSTLVPFLNMEGSTYSYEPINAIGSEAVPFYGEFDGQDLEIKNLTVYADPEDAGLFGYTAHGSFIHNLFLSNVTINSLGYTSSFEGLYGEDKVASQNTSLEYNCEAVSHSFLNGDEEVLERNFDASPIFDWDEETEPEPTITEVAPIVGFTSDNTNYKYKLLISGDFLTTNTVNTVKVDLKEVFKFFKVKKEEAASFPLQASSSVSLIASTSDNYGFEHSKVVSSLTFDFSLGAIDSKTLKMYVHLEEEHTNNIGLLIGHCDGSVSDCYVHNGAFEMNNGYSLSGVPHYSMQNGSTYGLIGLISGTVHNISAEESDAGTKTGKDIGVLDFSTVYNQIINNSSFSGSTPLTNGITYSPTTNTPYDQFLRINGTGKYVTLAEDTVSFNRQKIISNTDLGIFTIATNQSGTGMNEDAENGLTESVIRKENTAINENYYLYYATGEYDKTKGIDFNKYRDSFNSNNPSEFHLGYHLPDGDQITSESFEQRDRHQNYFFRFKIDSRSNKSFYFADIDKESDGGAFLSKYFENKLVDKDGKKIPASANSKRSGVMLRDSIGREITKLTSSFATPDLSFPARVEDIIKPKMYYVDNDEYNDPAANMVNFEIKTSVANVTVVAGLVDNSRPASLGVYKIDDASTASYGGLGYYTTAFNEPDYAFFMPTDDHLAYFDYIVENGVGKIKTYNYSTGNWEIADEHTEATIPNTYIPSGNSYTKITEQGYIPGKTRLYAHTFKLPQGRYCLGSATGTSKFDKDDKGSGTQGIAKIYYVCAQGQTDGQIEFIDNVFASGDKVEKVDFTKVEKYTYNPSTGVVTTNITSGDVEVYDPNDPRLENQRCYVSLVNSDRSTFDSVLSNLQFIYDTTDDKFKITSTTTGAIIHLAVNNYAKNHGITGLTNTNVVLIEGSGSTDDPLVYPAT